MIILNVILIFMIAYFSILIIIDMHHLTISNENERAHGIREIIYFKQKIYPVIISICIAVLYFTINL